MLKRFIIIIFFFSFQIMIGQENLAKELAIKTCEKLNTNDNLTFKDKLLIVYGEIVYPNVKDFNDKKLNDFFFEYDNFLMNNCPSYKQFVDKTHAGNSTVEDIIEELPQKRISKKACDKFKQIEEFYYEESSNNIVNVVFTENTWQDYFHDQTFTVNKVRWEEDCSFTLTFIRSDNQIRNQYIHPGDTFKYYVLKKRKNSYYLAIPIPNDTRYVGFELFVKD